MREHDTIPLSLLAGAAGTVLLEGQEAPVHRREGFETSVAGFAGRLPRGRRSAPTSVESWAEFEGCLGGGRADSYLAPAVRAFFANGGRRAWIAGLDDAGLASPGLDDLRRIDEIRLLAVPDLVVDATPAQAADRYRVLLDSRDQAILLIDPPPGLTPEGVQSWKEHLGSGTTGRPAALYYPWIRMTAERGRSPSAAPPSGAVAGTFARAESAGGIPTAPANLRLRGVCEVERSLGAGAAARLRRAGVNPLLSIGRGGVRAFGERTLHGDSITVVRLLAQIRVELERRSSWTVFEPPGHGRRDGVVRAITSGLRELWSAGALAGRTPDEAFFVRCERTEDALDDGRLICHVGVAPQRPAEFVVFHIGDRHAGHAPPTEGQEKNLALW